jgi:hypothetical protein
MNTRIKKYSGTNSSKLSCKPAFRIMPSKPDTVAATANQLKSRKKTFPVVLKNGCMVVYV